MARVSQADGKYRFLCPGCKETHIVDRRWTFNGSVDRPTFSPSILVRTGCRSTHYKQGDACWCTYNREHLDEPAPLKCSRCHSFVRDGRIQFLNDCTHDLAGQTVDLPEMKQ